MRRAALNASQKLKKNKLNLLWLIFILFFLDRITKRFFLTHFSPGESISVWGDKILFTLVFNKGAAFGSMQNSQALLTIISIIVLIILTAMLLSRQTTCRITAVGFSFIISGALGNLFDRIVHGHVIDFIDIDIPDIIEYMTRWPVFNIADSCITIGVILLLIPLLFNKEGKKDHAASAV